MSEVVSFEHVNLAEVDPNQKLITQGVYEFLIVPGSPKLITYTPATGPNAGVEKRKINIRLSVVNDPQFSGRSLFDNFYENDFSYKILRRLSDATGIPQGGDDLVTWLGKVATTQATFKVQVQEIEDSYTGETVKKNKINWFSLQPAA